MCFWGHPALQPLVSCGMVTNSDGVSVWVMATSPAAACLVVSQEQTTMAFMSKRGWGRFSGSSGV